MKDFQRLLAALGLVLFLSVSVQDIVVSLAPGANESSGKPSCQK